VGAAASANLYSLVTTARANGLEPFGYLAELFERLPAAASVAEIEALPPCNVKALLPDRKNASPAVAADLL
jgi:transposase